MSLDRKVLQPKENLWFDGGFTSTPSTRGIGDENWYNSNNTVSATKADVATKPPAARPNKVDMGQPKPPRSAFVCFTDAKKIEYAGTLVDNDNLFDVLATEWARLSPSERAEWDETARNDKVRFARETEAYKGPKHIPKRRAKKNPLAPKRPPSAFLIFSKTRREIVKQENPHLINTDISRLLGQMWRNLSAEERKPYETRTRDEHAAYKLKIKKFKEDEARKDAACRTSHRAVRKEREAAVRAAAAANATMTKSSPSFDDIQDITPLPVLPPAPPVARGHNHYHGAGGPSRNENAQGQQRHYYHSYYPIVSGGSFEYGPYDDGRYAQPASGGSGGGHHAYRGNQYPAYGEYHQRQQHADYQYALDPHDTEPLNMIRPAVRLPSLDDDDKRSNSHQHPHPHQYHPSVREGSDNNAYYPQDAGYYAWH